MIINKRIENSYLKQKSNKLVIKLQFMEPFKSSN